MTTLPWAHSLASSSSLTGPALAEAPGVQPERVPGLTFFSGDRGLDGGEESGKGLTGTKVNQPWSSALICLHRELSHEQDPLQEGLSGSGMLRTMPSGFPRPQPV